MGSDADRLMLSGAVEATSQMSLSFLENTFSSKRNEQAKNGNARKIDNKTEAAASSRWQRFLAFDPAVSTVYSAPRVLQIHHRHPNMQHYIAAASAVAMAQNQVGHASGAASTPTVSMQAPVTVRAVRPVVSPVVSPVITIASKMPAVAESRAGVASSPKTSIAKRDGAEQPNSCGQGQEPHSGIRNASAQDQAAEAVPPAECNKPDEGAQQKPGAEHDNGRAKRGALQDAIQAAKRNGLRNNAEKEEDAASVARPDASKLTQSTDGSVSNAMPSNRAGESARSRINPWDTGIAGNIASVGGQEKRASNGKLTILTRMNQPSTRGIKSITSHKRPRSFLSGDDEDNERINVASVRSIQRSSANPISSPRIVKTAADTSNCSPLAGRYVEQLVL